MAITAGLFNNEIDIKSNGWNSSFISVSINVPTFKWVKFLKPNFVSSKNCFGKYGILTVLSFMKECDFDGICLT